MNRGFGRFDSEARYEVADGPIDLIAADADGDGDLDLAVACYFGSQALLLVNSGGGGFDAARSLDRGVYLLQLVAGDLEGDGDLDLALAGLDGHVTLLLNQGRLTFQGRSGPFTGTGSLHSIDLGDLDGDRDLDLLQVDESILLSRNRGTASFSASTRLQGLYQPQTGILADVDGDGDLEVAVNDSYGETLVFFNQGDGTFEKPWFFAAPDPGPLAAADLDGDGDLDLAVSHRLGNTLALLPNVSTVPGGRDCNRNGTPDGCDLAAGTSADCDGSRVPDECEIASGRLADSNQNGVPDACELRPVFHRGDANADGALDLSDGLCVLRVLFQGVGSIPCRESADANNDGDLDCSDGVFILGFLFLGSAAPPAPGPPPDGCGPDSDPLGSSLDLGCESYSGC